MANKQFKVPINLVNLASDPGTASEGDIYYNTTSDTVKVYANGAWASIGSGGGGGSASDSFKTISVSGQSDVIADSSTDTLTIVEGTGITITTNANTDAITLGVTSSTYQPLDSELTALAGLTSAADSLPYFTGSGTASLATFTTFGRSLVDDADQATARTTLGLGIGTDVQAYSSTLAGINTLGSGTGFLKNTAGTFSYDNSTYLTTSSASSTYQPLDAELTAIAGLTSAADRLPYFTGSGAAALATFTTFGRSLVDDADASTARTTLGLGTMAVETASNYLTTSSASTTYAALSGATFTGAVSGTSLTLSGDLTVNGTTTTINSTTLTVDDKNIELGSVASPTNTTADGGGITLKGTTDKTFNWVNSTSAWTSSEHISVASGKNLLLNGSTSGTITITPTAIAGTNTITLPALTGTVALTSSPTFTGTPLSTTAAVDTNTTQIATTAYVVGQGYAKLAGAVFTGNIELDATKKLIFDGTTNEAYKTTLFVVDPTSDREILLPDAAGTIALTSDLSPYLTSSTASSTYAPKASPTFTGTVQLDTNATIAFEGSTSNAFDTTLTVVDPTANRTITLPNATGTVALTSDLSSYLTTATASSTYQPLDSELTAIAGLTSAADSLPYFTGSGTASLATFTTFGRSLIDDVDAATARTTLGLIIGTNVQGYSSTLLGISTLGSGTGFLKNTAGTFSYDNSTYITSAVTSLTGTANQITASAGTGSVTLSLPNAVTMPGSLTVTGNLIVNGTTQTTNSTTVTIDDPIITLGGDTAPASDDNKDRGVEFRWHNGTSAKVGFFGYDDSQSVFTFIPDATNSSEVFSGTPGTIRASSIDYNDGTATTALTQTFSSSGTVSSLSDTAFNSLTYAVAEYTIYVKNASGKYTSKVMLVCDGASSVNITEYAILTVGTAPTVSVSASNTTNSVLLTVSSTSATQIRIIRTLVAI